jgi:hypothetical protein
MSKEIGKIFGSSIQTFDPENVLEQMIEAQEGTVFVLGSRHIHTEGEPDDDNEVEITFAQIKKVRSK